LFTRFKNHSWVKKSFNGLACYAHLANMPCPGPVQPVPIDSTIPQGHTTVADLNEGEITGFKNLSTSSRKYFNGYHKAIP
jgi:hypothetical protein